MRKTSHIFILTCLILIASPFDVHAGQLTGKVVEVYNGCTIGILVDGVPVRIHLYGVDCPEDGQPFDREAKAATSGLTYGKLVTLQVTNINHRGEKIGTVILPGERNLNRELVKAGLARWNRQSAPDARILQTLENSAKNSRLGLWASSSPGTPLENKNSTIIHSTDMPEQINPSRSFDDEATVYVTSTGEKYHRHGCRYLMKSMIPITLGEVRSSGLVPCPTCDPPK